MAENSHIAWTHHTFNPVKGCTKVSAGCKNCYAEADTKRYGLKVWGPDAPRVRTAPDYWKQPHKWNKRAIAAGVRERVFCASWADVGEDHPDWVEPRRDLARLIEATPGLDWLLLTKRPENLVRLFRDAGWAGSWPENVWAGTTVEDQEQANARIPHLLRVPARIRFLSCEPLLEAVDLTAIPRTVTEGFMRPLDGRFNTISWVIVGGESHQDRERARIFDLDWARSLRDQCKAAGVPFFFKQAGSWPLEGFDRKWLRDPKGGDLQELPTDLRIREFPR